MFCSVLFRPELSGRVVAADLLKIENRKMFTKNELEKTCKEFGRNSKVDVARPIGQTNDRGKFIVVVSHLFRKKSLQNQDNLYAKYEGCNSKIHLKQSWLRDGIFLGSRISNPDPGDSGSGFFLFWARSKNPKNPGKILGFNDFLIIGIFSGFFENPRDFWRISGIRDFLLRKEFLFPAFEIF